MTEIIIANVAEIVTTLVVTLIGVAGTWLLSKIGKRQELASISTAMNEVIFLAQQTVGELQQTVVGQLKAGREDGKLTEEEIAALGEMLLDRTIEKMSAPTAHLLNAAAVDMTALIKGAGEDWIAKMK